MDQELRSVLDESGALHVPGGAATILGKLRAALEQWPDGASGSRISGDPELGALLSGQGGIGALVARITGHLMFPVRAIYFDKNDTKNWTLGWHQDRTIAVAERFEIPGYGPWTRKQGILHVQPPFEIIADLRTIRIHLDPVPADNAPLLVSPGSHRLGVVPADRCNAIAASRPVLKCLAEQGDAWIYHTPILHASDRSAPGQRRRVLQVDYAAHHLPSPLQWLGV